MKKLWNKLPRHAHITLIGFAGVFLFSPLAFFPRLSDGWLAGMAVMSLFGGMAIGGIYSDPELYFSKKSTITPTEVEKNV